MLNEGSVAYRPVSAYLIEKNIYKIDGSECYNPEDEEWEFLPGMYVLVEEKKLSGENVLVAVKNQGFQYIGMCFYRNYER